MACRLRVICVREDNVFDVQAVITRLIWTIWTLLSDVQERLLNCIIHSLILVLLHICISESGQHWFRQWLGAWSAPNHYLNQCWILLIGPLGINFSEMAIEINTFWLKKCTWNVFCELAAILSRGRWVNNLVKRKLVTVSEERIRERWPVM